MSNRKNNIKYKVSFKELWIYRIRKSMPFRFIMFYIRRLYSGILLKFNLKLKEVPLYRISPATRFDLGNKDYNYDKLYRSLLKTNGLDLKNHTPPMVFPLLWDDDSDVTKKALEQKFKYRVADGNHRIATLQFMNLSKKLVNYPSEIMIKVLVANEDFLARLDSYGFIDQQQGHIDAIEDSRYIYRNGVKGRKEKEQQQIRNKKETKR